MNETANIEALQPGTNLKNGEYRIVKPLGQGGFGITYEAEQISLKRQVAIKEFFMKDCCERKGESSRISVPTQNNQSLVAQFKGKFVKEARMIASMNNPHIVRVIDVFEENGTAYYVMEYLPGGSLADKVKKEGPLPEPQAEKYIRQVAYALAYIHGKNTVHLDVKPSNILLNANGEAVLIDFGISKHYDEAGRQTSHTPVGHSKGYAPPEQGKDGDVSQFKPSTDIYSLGATLYNLVTGTVPPDASSVLEDGLERPQGVSDRIWHAIEKAMQPRRKDRPQDIPHFLELLEADIDSDATIVTLPETPDKKPALRKRRSAWVWGIPAGIIAVLACFWLIFHLGNRSSETLVQKAEVDPYGFSMKDQGSYMDKIKTRAKVRTTGSGLSYEILKPGSSLRATSAQDTVVVNYVGRFIDGRVFDQNDNIRFPLNRVIKGWTDGLRQVGEGGSIRMYIPPELAYGEKGNGTIPPNSILVFEVDLLEVHPHQ